MYMTDEQVEKEFNDLLPFFKYVYDICGVEGYWYRLSLPDFSKGKYAGDRTKVASMLQNNSPMSRKFRRTFCGGRGRSGFLWSKA